MRPGRRFIGICALLASMAITAASGAAPPTPGPFVAADANDCGGIVLTWGGSVPPPSGFRIYRDGVLIGVLGGTATRYYDYEMGAPNSYNYCIEAFDNTGTSGQACDAAQLPVSPVTIDPADWYNDVFIEATGLQVVPNELFDRKTAYLATGRNNATPTGNTSREVQPGTKVIINTTGSVNRVDMIFRIKPGPGNYCTDGHVTSGLDPSSAPTCTTPTSGFWFDHITTPGTFATPSATALHNAAPGGWDRNVWSSRQCANPSTGVYETTEFGTSNPILPDGLFCAGTHIEYYFRVEFASGPPMLIPDPNCVIQNKGEGSIDGHRWADFTVLPDRWKDGAWAQADRDAVAPGCLLVVDLDDGHGDGRAWVSIADSVAATLQPRWGAHDGWHAISKMPTDDPVDVNDPANNRRPDGSVGFTDTHGGAAGTTWDLYRVRGARSVIDGNAGALGSQLATVTTGFHASGPTLDVLRQYYRAILILTGDRTASILGPFADRPQDDVQMLQDFLSGGAGTVLPRALLISGSGFAHSENVNHSAFLANTMGAAPRALDFRTFTSFTPTSVRCDLIPALNTPVDLFGAVNADPIRNEVLALSGSSVGQVQASQYLYYKPTPTSPTPPLAPYIAAIYAPSTWPSLTHPGVTFLDGRDINNLRENGGNGTGGRTEYYFQLLANILEPLNCGPGFPGPPLGVGEEAGGGRANYLHVRSNPARGAVTFELGLGAATRARVGIYDLSGRMIRTLNDRVLDAGPHVLAWDGRDERGVSTPPGVYMIRVRDVGRDLVAAKVVMLR